MYAAKQYTYVFFFAAPPSCCSRRSLRCTSLHTVVRCILHLHPSSEQGRGEQVWLSDMYSDESGQNRSKNPQENTKGAQIKGRKVLIIGGQLFYRTSIAMLQKQNMPKIKQRTIVSGQIFKKINLFLLRIVLLILNNLCTYSKMQKLELLILTGCFIKLFYTTTSRIKVCSWIRLKRNKCRVATLPKSWWSL